MYKRGPYKKQPAMQRIRERLAFPSSGCWEWIGALGNHGYAVIQGRGPNGAKTSDLAHRVVWAALRGKIPAGLEIDHLCRVRRCVNPAHLRTVTRRQNLLAARSESLAAVNAAKTRCPAGHTYAGANLIVDHRGSRKCRECKRERRSVAHAR